MRNRLRMILLGVFCAGVLLMGIGAGIAVIEYTQLEYTGIHVIGGENTTEAKYEFEIEFLEGEKLCIMNQWGVVEVLYDENVPENQVQCSIRYNSNLVSVLAGIDDGTNIPAEERTGNTWLYFSRRYIADDFDLLMQNKDAIIAELKEGKIGSYTIDDTVKEITVKVNPKLKDTVFVENWW